MNAAIRTLRAAIERDPTLADRLLAVAEPPADRPTVTSAAAAAAVLAPLLRGRATEALAVAALDRRLRVIRAEILTTGNDGFCIVDPKQILRFALLSGRSGAHAIVVAHNHPSGDPTPSVQDQEVTKRLGAACRAVGIQLVDHIVIVDTGHASLAERGELPAY